MPDLAYISRLGLQNLDFNGNASESTLHINKLKCFEFSLMFSLIKNGPVFVIY